ncbi:MAG TPA: ABC transporter ATP-binding protein [Phototrophicaceae bacterium]|nr:ABC transporter ATP-binding protein [Phototrophicaceae bacterium]
MTYAVEIQDIHKHFGSLYALQGLSLQIERGITYGLLGPNGAGKTTLIRAIVGLIKPDSGRVTVLGQAVPGKEVLKHIGYMTQSMALYDELTVRQNVTFFGAIGGLKNPELQRSVDELIELVDLTARADSRVRELSGGMKQRCSLICALVHHPEVVLLDEPTVGVDPQLRVQFWSYFKELNRQGVTLIVSSHVMDEAERCDRLGFVRQGKLLAEGQAAELRRHAGTATLEEAFLQFAESPIPSTS